MSFTCPECKSLLILDERSGLVCASCGLIQEDQEIPHSPPPIARQRLGSMIAKRSYVFKDNGKRVLPRHLQLKFDRLKELQDSIYSGSSLDLFCLYRDLDCIGDFLMLPEEVLDRSKEMFEDFISKVKNPYNSYALLLATCLMIASRELGERSAVKLSEIIDAFQSRGYALSKKLLVRTLSYASNIIPFTKKFRGCEEYVSKILAKLRKCPYTNVRIRLMGMDPDDYFERLAKLSKSLLLSISPIRRSGKNPFLLAASAVYVSSTLLSGRPGRCTIFSKVEYSKEIGIAEYTLRCHIRTVFEPLLVKMPSAQAPVELSN
ncbi:MAG: TFIIB-type zinc ribbon-containing protein [Candidatus Methanomethylicaceae archaeon]